NPPRLTTQPSRKSPLPTGTNSGSGSQEPHGLTLQAWRVNQQTVLTWNKGPKAGKIYDMVPDSNRAGASVAQLRSEIDDRLKEVSDGLLTSGDFSRWFNAAFYGSESQPGLIKTRLANAQVTALFSEIEQTGVNKWLRQSTTELKCQVRDGRDVYDAPGKYGSHSLRVFQPTGDLPDLSNAHAVHYTWSTAFDGILNADALLSGNEIRSQGLNKVSGEDGKGDSGATPNRVSFCGFTYEEERGLPKTALGTMGPFMDLSYPMAFIVTKDKADAVALRSGWAMAIPGEIAVEGKVDLSKIGAVVVPPFAVLDVQRLLEQHGRSHIAVLPSFRAN
ncbi:hypothetical protein, partial [Burkholderia lata]